MKKILLFLFLINFIPAYADGGKDLLVKSFLPYRTIGFQHDSDAEKLKYLQQFVGDTIIFNFPATYLSVFSVERPDTVWLKKRPKRNPVQGRHYVLNNAYKGIDVDGEFLTPSSTINGRSFAVLNVKPHTPSSDGFFISLLDIDNMDIVGFNLYSAIPYEFSFTTTKTQKLLQAFCGQTVYYCANLSSYSSSKEFRKFQCLSGDFHFNVSPGMPGRSWEKYFSLDDCVELRLQDEYSNVKTVSSDWRCDYSIYGISLLTEAEYAADYKPLTINSDVDLNILEKAGNFPFSFSYILASSKSYVSVYQSTEHYIGIPSATLNKRLIAIGDKVTTRGVDYYKACYNGKAFFIKTEDVILDETNQRKLDSLVACPQSVRDEFFFSTLALNKALYLQFLSEALDEINDFSKYGIAIPKWGVRDESRYTSGTGVYFDFYNPTKNTIKYVNITFQGYNAVDDPEGKVITKRCIGPIEPGEIGSYRFEYVWFTDAVEYAKIRSIVVQYKNGTSRTVSNSNAVIFRSELRDFFMMPNPVENLK